MSIHDINSNDFETADTGSNTMTFQWWHEIAEASDRQKQLVKSGSYVNYVLWKSATIDKQVVQQFHHKKRSGNIIEYSSSLYSYNFDATIPSYTFSLVE
tara:strand:- start:32 stop:328 length:297 start_codon:yes stop_codon:yes gene_type:complete